MLRDSDGVAVDVHTPCRHGPPRPCALHFLFRYIRVATECVQLIYRYVSVVNLQSCLLQHPLQRSSGPMAKKPRQAALTRFTLRTQSRLHACAGCRDTAQYNITVTVTWTSRTHPLSPEAEPFWERLVLFSHDPRCAPFVTVRAGVARVTTGTRRMMFKTRELLPSTLQIPSSPSNPRKVVVTACCCRLVIGPAV